MTEVSEGRDSYENTKMFTVIQSFKLVPIALVLCVFVRVLCFWGIFGTEVH